MPLLFAGNLFQYFLVHLLADREFDRDGHSDDVAGAGHQCIQNPQGHNHLVRLSTVGLITNGTQHGQPDTNAQCRRKLFGLKYRSSAGIARLTWSDYQKDLDGNLADLSNRLN